MSNSQDSVEQDSDRSPDYEIRLEPCKERVRVEYQGTWIADSMKAMILHETRMPTAYYFPKDDVRMEFLEKTTHQTHCPFKGNASYWTIRTGGDEAENAVWGYEDPNSDGEDLRNYVSFYQSKISAIYEGSDEVPFSLDNIESAHANPIAGWLLKDSWKATSTDDVLRHPTEMRYSNIPHDRDYTDTASTNFCNNFCLA